MKKIYFGFLLTLLISGTTAQAQTEECINIDQINVPLDGSPLDYTQGKINLKTNIGTNWGKQSAFDLYFIGWLNIDVSNESCKNKKLTISKSATQYIAIDGDTIYLSGFINHVNPKFQFSVISGNLIVQGEFSKVSLGNSTNIIDHICLNTESCGGVGIEEQENKVIKIGPNPTNGTINVNFNYSELNIYSSLGDLVLTAQKNQTKIDLSFLTSGYYFVKAISQGKIISQKILLQ